MKLSIGSMPMGVGRNQKPYEMGLDEEEEISEIRPIIPKKEKPPTESPTQTMLREWGQYTATSVANIEDVENQARAYAGLNKLTPNVAEHFINELRKNKDYLEQIQANTQIMVSTEDVGRIRKQIYEGIVKAEHAIQMIEGAMTAGS